MKKNILLLISAILGAIAGLQAQGTLYVKQANGIENSFALTNIRNMSFPSNDSILINKNNGSKVTYSLNNIRYFNFINFSLGIQQNAILQNNILLFPNPVNDEFQIIYQSNEQQNLQLQIIDEQGIIVMQQILNGQFGRNLFKINVRELSQGLYLCRLQRDNIFELVKFVKN